MTPRQFALYCEGYASKTEHEMEKLAWHAANIINGFPNMSKRPKKAVTVDQLLGRNKQIEFADKESFKAHMRERERELEAG